MPGWGDAFKVKTLRDSLVTVGSATPAIFMSILLFILPQVSLYPKLFIHLNSLDADIFFLTNSHDANALKYFYQTYDFWPFTPMKNSLKNAPSLITWRLIETKMCWGVIFLLGGGFALAKVCFSKLIKTILEQVIITYI